MSVVETLLRITAALDKAGVAYMISGSYASAYYGAPRSTQDIDFVIEADPAQLRMFVQSLPTQGYYVDLDAALAAHGRRSMFNVIDLVTGWKADLIFRKSRPFSQEEFRRRQLVTLRELSVFLATAEDVIISKLEWSKLAQSQRHVNDAAGILRVRGDSLDQTYLERWIHELSLESEWRDAQRLAGA